MELTALETHVSWLIFTSGHVYKIKRPVDLGFVDHTTIEARRRSCRAEVTLNRRLAPDIYEGVGQFNGPDGAAEPIVVMRRLPEGRALGTLATNGSEDLAPAIETVALILDRFHRRARRGSAIDARCTAAAVRLLWEENLGQTASILAARGSEPELERIAALARRYLNGRAALFAERIAAGKSVDGHGDLLASDVFIVDDGPRILDCLEFDDRLRHLDVMADLASLLMDLEALGRPDLSTALLAAYRRSALDDCPSSLVDHYIAHRACVRSKVAFLQGRPEAAPLLELALRHLELARVRLVLMGGLPGSGKSTLAAALARRTGWRLLGTDRERREMIDEGVAGPPSGGFGAGHYRPVVSDQVYERLIAQASRLLARGQSVILDGTWFRARWREQAAAAAESVHADLHQLVCEVPSEVAADRIAGRQAEPGLLSEATIDTHLIMRDLWEPWPQSRSLDGTQPIERLVDAAMEGAGRQ